ncbi:MAG: hypothetical protein J2P48_10455 [Alphaproteobacteria bacterium]|nr:hypothetical protein [Alphaproteobacteria bacterium]
MSYIKADDLPAWNLAVGRLCEERMSRQYEVNSMQQRSPSDDHSLRNLPRRLDRVFGEINAFLLVLAIGLAVLDVTCFVGLKVSDEIQWAQLATAMPPLSSERSIQSKPEPTGASQL